jgi:hypothetical protein
VGRAFFHLIKLAGIKDIAAMRSGTRAAILLAMP